MLGFVLLHLFFYTGVSISIYLFYLVDEYLDKICIDEDERGKSQHDKNNHWE